MSFETLKEEELLAAAEMLAVDLETSRNTKGRINPKLAAAAFAEEGVTWDIYTAEKQRLQEIQDELVAKAEEEKRLEEQRAANVIREQDVLGQEDDVEPEADAVVVTRQRRARRPNEVLVKMDRQNPYFEVAGKIFTYQHPFVLMSEDEAQYIFDIENGFRVATPREAAEYYS